MFAIVAILCVMCPEKSTRHTICANFQKKSREIHTKRKLHDIATSTWRWERGDEVGDNVNALEYVLFTVFEAASVRLGTLQYQKRSRAATSAPRERE